MNRRSFLSGLLGAVGAATLDPEELLWKPSKKIFIPSPPKGLVFHKDAFSLRMIDLPMPNRISRMDTLYGFGRIHPDAEPLVLDVLSSVDMEFSSEELLMTMEDYKTRFIDPAVRHYSGAPESVVWLDHDGILRSFS